ncbi:hypothetical protein OG612_41725 [Streptomyces sp. NBC_01527]|uniref:hypothetical protein n=1 Tax=Streptomyces sp. NBC_01527 TaxID=2903894 RepID=UPI003870C130
MPALFRARTGGPPAGLEYVTSNPRPGLRRWVLSTLTSGGGREIYAELHHDGSVVPAADLSWKAMREAVPGEVPEECLVLRQDVVGACCQDLAAIAVELARRLRVDSVLHLTAAIAAAPPAASPAPVICEYGSFMTIADDARRPHRIQPVAATLTPRRYGPGAGGDRTGALPPT